MKVTALEEYGLRCMILLARNAAESSLTIPEISAREGLSLPYAGKLLMILRNAGLVKAARGRQGGYVISKPPEQIRLKEIFCALGKPLFSSGHCERYAGENECCVHAKDCTVKTVWGTVNNFVSGYLNNTTLADLALGKTVTVSSNREPDKKSS
jgi:Rrf2 family iron-sulfur cluster assembly transcriptional regulator